MKKTIFKVIQEEIEISFPHITFNLDTKNIYFNYQENRCIKINAYANSIEHLNCNYGLEYDQISSNDFHLSYGTILQHYFDIFNNIDK
jgi:hypothetical protein